MIEIRRYVTNSGKDLFGEWLAKLKDVRVRARIVVRIDRLAAGNFGDCKALAAACMSCGLISDRDTASITRWKVQGAFCFSPRATRAGRLPTSNVRFAYLNDYQERRAHDDQ